MAKPASGSLLDSGNSLYTSLTAVWGLLENTGTSLADSKGSNTATLNHGSWSTDGAGDPCLSVAGGAGTVNAVTLTTLIDTGNATNVKWSIAWRGSLVANNTAGMLCGDASGNAFVWLEGGTQVQHRYAGDTIFSEPSLNAQHDWLLVFDDTDAHKMRLYKDGTAVASSPQSVGAAAGLKFDRFMCGYSSASFAYEGKLSYLYFWNGRALSSADATSLAASPYQVFVTTASYSLNAAAGSYAVTGSAITARVAWTANGAAGSYAETGTAIGTAMAISLIVSAGSDSVTGFDASFSSGATYALALGTAAYASTGAATSPLFGLTATAGSYALTGAAGALSTTATGSATPEVTVIGASAITIAPDDLVEQSPNEQKIYAFDYDARHLPVGVTLSQSVFSITAIRPLGDTALVKDSEAIDVSGRKTSVRLSGGTLGAIYRVANQTTRDEVPEQIDEVAFFLKIEGP